MWVEQAWGAVCASWAVLLAWPWGVIGGVVQTVVLVATLLYTVFSSERSRRAADDAAARAEAAASGTIDAMERIAQAVEAAAARLPIDVQTLSTEARGHGTVSGTATVSTPARAEWRLSHYQGDKYQLDNFGAGDAYQVRVSADPSMLLRAERFTEGVDIPAGQAEAFIAARTMGTRDSTITVTWKAAPDDVADLTWRYPLPPKS